MLPSEKQIKALVNKLKKKAEANLEAKKTVKSNTEIVENTSNEVFDEMKKLPFTE